MQFRHLVTALLFFVSTSISLMAQAPLWHDLKPGRYAVGFRVLWRRDFSRTWGHGPETARPVRISVWYPIDGPAHTKPMPYSGYLNVPVPDKGFDELAEGVAQYDLDSIRNFFPGNEQLISKLLTTPTAAHFEDRAARGKFPLVVYSLGQNDHTLENIVLWEFLASHGYVVVTVPHIGTSPRRFQLLVHDPLMYEAQVRDLEFVIQQMHNEPYVDADDLAVMGHSFGGIYSLLTAMRNNKVRAVVGLDPTYISKQPSFHYKFWEAPYYDIANLKAPMLVLYKGIERENLRTDIVNDLKYSDRYLFEFPSNVHGDFNSSPMVTAIAPDGVDYADREYATKFRSREAGVRAHEMMCKYVLNFLDTYLKKDPAGSRFLRNDPEQNGAVAGTMKTETKTGLKAPTEEELYTIMKDQGLDAALKALREAKARYPGQAVIREATIRRIGNEAGYYGKANEAVAVFTLYVEAFPASPAAYRSLAGAYEDSGNKEMAIRNYEKAIELDPADKDSIEHVKKLKAS
jgi:dienelactone hydrolase